MSRFINPVPQYTRAGKPLSGLELHFYDVDTGARKDTFLDKDESENLKNTNPVICDDDGRVKNIFYTGLAKVIAIFQGEQIFERDNVGNTDLLAPFDFYSSVERYQLHSFTTTQDGRTWQSLGNENVNNDPTTDDGTNWKGVSFNELYAKGVTYNKLNKSISNIDGLTYISVADSNQGNEPSVDSGANWVLDNPTLNYASGKTYFIGEQSFDVVDNRTYISQLSQSGNQPNSDSGLNWLPKDGKVTKPINSAPADAATDISRTPTLTSSAYEVNGSNAEHKYSQFLVYSDVGLTTLVYKSDITSDLEAHQVNTPLDRATTYYWISSHSGDRAGSSVFSDATSFTTVPELSELFAINSNTGSGTNRTSITGVNLVTGSGSIWTKNRNSSSFLKRLDTSRGLKELDLAEGTPQAVNATGLLQYLSSGFEVGSDDDYNKLNDTISSYIFKNFTGFHDTVQYVGNSLDRDISHSLGTNVAGYIVKNIDTPSVSHSGFWFRGSAMTSTEALDMSGGALASPLLGGATSTTFNVTSGLDVNSTGVNYICELFADNPSLGITGGSYLGTGSAGLDISPGFAGGLLITTTHGGGAGVAGTHIADIKAGTASHLLMDSTGNAQVSGSVASFDADGVTLDSNSMNASGITYHYIIVADPS